MNPTLNTLKVSVRLWSESNLLVIKVNFFWLVSWRVGGSCRRGLDLHACASTPTQVTPHCTSCWRNSEGFFLCHVCSNVQTLDREDVWVIEFERPSRMLWWNVGGSGARDWGVERKPGIQRRDWGMRIAKEGHGLMMRGMQGDLTWTIWQKVLQECRFWAEIEIVVFSGLVILE